MEISKIQEDITKATAQLAQVETEIADCEKSANTHEAEARAYRKRREDLKTTRASLIASLGHSNTVNATLQAQAAANQAASEAITSRGQAEGVLKELQAEKEALAKLKKELAEAIAAVKGTVPKEVPEG